ncbi:translocation/assembly module TamB domain-containing protein [Winogradskyella psychrotolerans]|uniref:translocation/assembly module TamB domain-containing protein n=1 Tax=Winogradskyella psychrotolerans TaxID=1344585 RepID=UPI001C07E944|nr:translocation/assembly module TamB domain-containing protein [Winogradskyella psychrotolerans]MBU2927700.1 translocation/assembly module TamB domain-containing protein [Winogradskyella psychrotolerans]
MNKTEDTAPQIPGKRKFRWLRRTLRVLLGILVFLFLVILFVRSPWGQSIIVDKAVSFVADKTGTKVAIEKLFITFDGDVQLDGLYLEDIKGDTLVYSKSLEANIPLWKMIRGEGVGVDALDWDGLRANIIRKDSITGYNFQFLIDAFASTDTTTVKTDTTSTPLNLVIGNLNFNNFDIVFDDAVAGIDSRFKIGELKADMETTNIEDMIFEASDIELNNANIKFIQKPAAIDTTSSDAPLPKLVFENIALNNVVAYYESQPDRLIADVDISEFETQSPNINLADSDFSLKKITLKNSRISLTTEAEMNGLAPKIKDVTEDSKTNNNSFEWPQLNVNVAAIDFENNTIDYRVGNAKPTKDVFNPDAIALSNFTLQAKDILLKDKNASLNLEQLNFNEASGLNLNQLAVNFNATDQNMRLDDLKFKLNNNSISGYAHLEYQSLSKLIDAPETTKVNLNLPSFQLSLTEIFKFQPDLKNNEYLNKLSKKLVLGSLNASGTLASIKLNKAELNWGNSTQISTNGTLQNITDTETLVFDIPQFTAVTKRSDLIQFVSEKDLGVSLPKDVKFVAQFKGNLEDISTKAKLTTTQGIATVDGNYKNAESIAFNADISIDDYKLNELLNNPQLGALSLSITSQGNGNTINTLNANLDGKISEFQLNNYDIKDLNISGDIVNGAGNINSTYKDDNLNATLEAYVVLDSINPEIKVDLNVIGANLEALGLMQRNVKTAMHINASFKGNGDSYDASAKMNDGVVVYDNRTYLIGDLDAVAHVDNDTTSVSLQNKIIDLNLQSNANPQTFSKAIQRHVLSYFYRDETVSDTISDFVNLKLEGKIAESSLLNDVFLVNVKDLDTIDFAVDFNEKARIFKANITAPHLNYSGNTLDSLAFSMDTDPENFNFNFGFNNVNVGPLDVPKTVITGKQTDHELALNFSGYHEEETLMNVNTKITGSRDQLRFTVNPDSLILNKKKWIIPSGNEVILTEKNLEFNDFKITKNNQSIELTDTLENIAKKHIAIIFENYDINEFFNYLSPKAELATGKLNGDFVLEDPFENAGIIADLSIKDFYALQTDLGTLSINGNSLGTNSYAFNAGLKGGDIDFDLTGDYTVTNNIANLDLDFDINEFKIKALNTLSQGEVKNSEGSFSGAFRVTGTTADPQYDGYLTFNNASFNIAKLNSKFSMANEKLNINNSGLSMKDFTIRDENDNALVLSGNVGTESFINPTFDLTVKTKNFQVLNATKEDNEEFYGKVTFDANAKLTGDLQIPKLDTKLTLGSDTDFTYVLPSSVASVEERDGVVVFVNRENRDAILTQTEEQTATIKGFDISALFNVGKNAAVTIIIDEETGDNFKISGEGDFVFTMKPNGRITLTGAYEISEGHYELNLYNLVNRKFLIAQGSRVTWSGDPFDAKLDVRAIYNLETSAYGLMASQISGADSSVKSKYQEVLPFNVYLNIDGELLQPKISFGLDMPEEEQGAVSGQVYSRVQQVNQQEGELNRQVFSLLVLNRFYPDSGSDGSDGGFATIARDNLNDAVSDQLNAFSDKLLGRSGIELDFGLNSYTDYQGDSPTDRTELEIAAKKKLFNDRLTVSVGSDVDIQGSSSTDEETPIIGNVSLEYALTEDGRYRLKGFRKSEFENVIDGQTIVSGISLIFTKEFNQFNELWDAILRSKKEKEAASEAEDVTQEKQEATDESMEQKTN